LQISIVLLAAPVVATAGAAFFLGEEITGVQLAGFIIVLSSIGFVVLAQEPDEAEALAEGVAGTEAP
jgi:drug/metabolite transporter (DMT)-like permease